MSGGKDDTIVIIGGGAAGMMAAIAAAGSGRPVLLLEQNEKLGKKLFITGKGRCNLTNASSSEQHLSSVVSNSRFLYSAETAFDAEAVMRFFESLGLRLKTERGERVFPVSDHSSDVIRTLEYECRRLGVQIRLHTKVKGLLVRNAETVEQTTDSPDTAPGEADRKHKKKKTDEKPLQQICGAELADGQKIPAAAVILATGGISYPLTGADGSGHAMAEKVGHKITGLRPALVPLMTKEGWVSQLAGLSLRNVSVTVKDGKKKLYEDFGEMLFTHRGVSGPVILSASSFVSRYLPGKLQLLIDLKPALEEEKLDHRLIRELEATGTKQMKTVMAALLPHSLIGQVLRLAQVEEAARACDISKQERRAILHILKAFPLTITGTEGFEQAIITQGGIHTKEINPSTMESKLVSGLYFAGECMDVDALTGGFNLQIAWSTGRKAGLAAASTM